jgi:hypothetical protein
LTPPATFVVKLIGLFFLFLLFGLVKSKGHGGKQFELQMMLNTEQFQTSLASLVAAIVKCIEFDIRFGAGPII